MNYIKQFWVSATTSSTVDSQQQQAFNSAAASSFTTPTNIITTTQRPQQLIFHTTSSLRPEMTVSPTDSFHSASSTYEMNEKEMKDKGNVNKGYTGSAGDLSAMERQRQMQPHQNNQVVHREQYWTWNWPVPVFWESWNNREKIFLIVIVILSLSVLILISILSVVLTRNMQLRNFIFNRLGSDINLI